MNNFLDFLIAVFTGLTALISLRQMFTQLPFVRAQIYDIPNSTKRNTVAEKMQMEGYFMLQITAYGGRENSHISWLKVSNCQIGESPTFNFSGEALEEPRLAKKKLSINSDYPAATEKNFVYLIKPDNPKEGTLTVTVGFGALLRRSTKVRYRQTEYFS